MTKKRAKKAARPAKRARSKPAPKRVQPVPAGFHTATPELTVQGAAKAIDFYKRAFGAKERVRMPAPDGTRIMHAEIKIGDSIVFVADEFPDWPGPKPRAPQALGGTTTTVHLYVPDVDAAFKRAVAAGAEVRMPVSDMFWGDRYGKVADPYGHEWGLGTHKEDLSSKETAKRAQAFFAQAPTS